MCLHHKCTQWSETRRTIISVCGSFGPTLESEWLYIRFVEHKTIVFVKYTEIDNGKLLFLNANESFRCVWGTESPNDAS